ncbi:cobalamin-binding protein [Alteromonas ponticola]|uniref:Cobalamin-binding protein n=1 Tax=Alteromonas aquimaris TaxID=2998417 RepID=A0ABT3P428_9ALTE|nr:cobalamin-binding protein [Alteromonas aquimaris]MCW8107508.1 cobalamin-binding protein [Alteromonas aquimaris]
MIKFKNLLLLALFLSASVASTERIITLSPHLTEWVYSLQSGDKLVAVSEFSDFPNEAKQLPVVASHHGVNFKRLIALKPTFILAWDGGNKTQDIARLRALGYEVFTSSPNSPAGLSSEIRQLAKRLNKTELAKELTHRFTQDIAEIRQQFGSKKQRVFYYYWEKPLMTIGAGTWANQLLNLCGAQTIFSDSPVDFPEVSLHDVLKRQPTKLIASSHHSQQVLEQFWKPHRNVLKAPLIKVNPDIFGRFTLRLPGELLQVCEKIASEPSPH